MKKIVWFHSYRDFIYVDDFINLFDKTLKNKKSTVFLMYQMEPISIKEIFKLVINLIKPKKK